MRIAVVDPSRTVQKIVSQLLETRHHEVRPFADAPEALEFIAADEDVSALVTSVELPSMSGIELCRRVRAMGTGVRPLYVVLMSSNYDSGKLVEALDNGADDFIGKPPAVEEMYARLRAAERIDDMQRKLMVLAMTDPLTGVLNRRAFFDRAHEVCREAAAGGALSAILFDIDNFKWINDDFGHDVGDRVIRALAGEAAALKEILGRLGGEEFSLLLPSRTLDCAIAVAEELRLRLAGMRLDEGGQAVTFTASFGVSEWRPGDTIDTLLKRADVALYRAKELGRNRVVAENEVTNAGGEGQGIGIARARTR
jgi:diguanylate cyclase (GGDEF)-like protein